MKEFPGDLSRDIALVIHAKGILLELPAGKAVAQPPAGPGAFGVRAASGPAPGAGVILLDDDPSLVFGHFGESAHLVMNRMSGFRFHAAHLERFPGGKSPGVGAEGVTWGI
jgi:hypothetical protein